MPDNQIHLPNPPEIPGLCFRHFRGEEDYAPLAAVLTESSRADNEERTVTAANLATAFSHALVNCNPVTDMIIAEVNGEMVGYTRGWWTDESPDTVLYHHNGFLLPAWRLKGVGTAMLGWIERRLREISQVHPPQHEKQFQVSVSQSQQGTANLLEHTGYQAARYYSLMVRPDLDDIPKMPLPAGLETRLVTANHYQLIWDLIHATNQDSWDTGEATESAYQEWLMHPHFQPQLWQIAWDIEADIPVGHVLTYINHEENQQFDRRRGYTEGVGVHPSWRRRGLARALISLSLRAQKEAGMTESALITDSDPNSGAGFDLSKFYESLGFQTVNRDTVYRKRL